MSDDPNAPIHKIWTLLSSCRVLELDLNRQMTELAKKLDPGSKEDLAETYLGIIETAEENLKQLLSLKIDWWMLREDYSTSTLLSIKSASDAQLKLITTARLKLQSIFVPKQR